MIPLHAKVKFAVDVVVCIVGLARYRKSRRDTRLLALWFALAVVISIVEYYLAVHSINNLWINHLFTPVEYAFLVWIIAYWQKNPRMQFTLRLSSILFAAFCLISLILFENIRSFNTITGPLEGVLLVGFSGTSLIYISKSHVESLSSRPEFWISSAIVVYFSGLVVLYSLSNTLLSQSLDALRTALVAHTVVGIVANILYGVAFLCPQTR